MLKIGLFVNIKITFTVSLNLFMISAIKKRRSVREYLTQAISEEKLKEILTAAMYAPSANALYPWEIIVIRDPQNKDRLSKVTPWALHAAQADVVLAILGKEKDSDDWVEDCSIVAEHMWLEATEQELASCWIQIYGNDNAEKEVRNILGIPPEIRVLCLMPLGYPAVSESEHSEEEFNKKKIKKEKY